MSSLHVFSLRHIVHLLHIVFKFALHSWQVPRSSVGRALYRESGNIITLGNIVFVVMSSQSQKTSFSESLPTCTLQYIRYLLHIILKFALPSWQVPRSSVGRALYRESGPSQDGDPVPGNLPFFLFIFHLFHFLFHFFNSFFSMIS